jgi:hypothetical protein
MEPADWINLVGVTIAALSALWAVISARKAKAAEAAADSYRARAETYAKQAADAAEKAAMAEQQSAEAAQRAADALEAQHQLAVDQAEADEGVPWRLSHRKGDTYELHNDTTTPKHHVSVQGTRILRPVTAERIDGRSSIEFMAIPFSGGDERVTVTWHRTPDMSDPAKEWTGTKPAKPRGSGMQAVRPGRP